MPEMTMTEQLKLVLTRQDMSIKDVAKKLNVPYANLYRQFRNNTFSIIQFADVLRAVGCSFNMYFDAETNSLKCNIVDCNKNDVCSADLRMENEK